MNNDDERDFLEERVNEEFMREEARACPHCDTLQSVKVRPFDLYRWKEGMYIQDAFPYLTANEREVLMTGICPDCWDQITREEDDE